MGVNIHNLIAAISPEAHCKPELIKKVRQILKDGKGYLEAAKVAKSVGPSYVRMDDVIHESAFKLSGYKNPISKSLISYDVSDKTLEQIYFWTIDYMKILYDISVDKLIDNFSSSSGSGYFSEFQQRATRMQDEAMKILGGINQIIKTILNIVYDLKEFKIRLAYYEDLKHELPGRRRSAMLTLKEIWLNTVDAKRGTASIRGLTQQLDFVTLTDAFMFTNDLEKVKDLDLNERVKNIVLERLGEYNKWIEISEQELRKRFEIEKIYLQSEVNQVKLYARWVKPYLEAANQLEQTQSNSAALVTTFNTAIFELKLLGQKEYKLHEEVSADILHADVAKMNLRTYNIVSIVDLQYRAIPERSDQRGGYTHRGTTSLVITSYALNEDEIKVLREELERDDLGDIMKQILGSTDESLGKIQADIDEFLDPKKEEREALESKKKKKSDDANPFTALFTPFKIKKKKKKVDLSKGVPPDNEYEKALRSRASIKARKEAEDLHSTFKKNNGMFAL
tara:strand:- start:133 stop:1659 length:1527 start_codon:yes stop_codon:yes gene_type:complete